MDIKKMDIEEAVKHAFELIADSPMDNLMYAGEDFVGLYAGLESKYQMDSTDFFNIFAHAYQIGFLYGRKAEKEGWEPRPLEEDDIKP